MLLLLFMSVNQTDPCTFLKSFKNAFFKFGYSVFEFFFEKKFNLPTLETQLENDGSMI